jgi:hypothetical protein
VWGESQQDGNPSSHPPPPPQSVGPNVGTRRLSCDRGRGKKGATRHFSNSSLIKDYFKILCLCLFQGLVAGLLRPRPFLKQIEHSRSSVSGTPKNLLFFYNLKLNVLDRHRSQKPYYLLPKSCITVLTVLGKCFCTFPKKLNTSRRFIVDMPVSYLVCQRYKLLSGVFSVHLYEGKLRYMYKDSVDKTLFFVVVYLGDTRTGWIQQRLLS